MPCPHCTNTGYLLSVEETDPLEYCTCPAGVAERRRDERFADEREQARGEAAMERA